MGNDVCQVSLILISCFRFKSHLLNYYVFLYVTTLILFCICTFSKYLFLGLGLRSTRTAARKAGLLISYHDFHSRSYSYRITTRPSSRRVHTAGIPPRSLDRWRVALAPGLLATRGLSRRRRSRASGCSSRRRTVRGRAETARRKGECNVKLN